ncbi:sulfatase-like hydrolase/transferase [Tabrizicola sp.]|uniref:sulfatase-like hydrolase/transferase n=1 Tax=Tabrizicola sp. TaxID=2005166 RepID=UPI0035B3BC1C
MWISLGLAALAVAAWWRALGSRAGVALAVAGVLACLLLSVAWLVADRLTGSGIDASVVYHLRTGLAAAGFGAFYGLIAAAVAAVAGCLLAAGLVWWLVRTPAAPRFGHARGLAGTALLAAALWLHPAVGDLVRLEESARHGAMASAGPPPEGFVPVGRLAFAGERRNLVFLYLESVERSYFDETRFPGLMPELKALEAEAVSFTDLGEVEEAGWTIAGMVASQCGMPLIGSGAGFDEFLPGASCLGDLLKAQGYALSYLGGADLGFAGKGTFYDSHGFGLVEGKTQLQPLLPDPAYVNEWGLFDDSLYTLATDRFDALAAGEGPFGLVMLTLDTHHPFGFASAACADRPYGDGGNEFLNAVHCADRLAAGFIRHVRANPAFKDTLLVVASDHMAMPNLAREALESGERRNLLMLFAPGLAPRLVDKPGTTLDTGPTVLGLMGAPTPALGFGRDLLADGPTLGDRVDGLIGAGRGYLAAMWAFPQIAEGLVLDAAGGEVVLGDRRLKVPVLFQLNPALAVTAVDFDLSADITLPELVAGFPGDQRFAWLDRCARTSVLAATPAPAGAETCLLAGSLDSPGLRQIAVGDGVPVAPEVLAAAFAPDAAPFRDEVRQDLAARRQFAAEKVIDYTPPNGLGGEVAIRSAGYLTGNSWVMNPDTGEKVALIRGLTLLGLNPDSTPVKLGHVDTCGYGGRQVDEVPLEGGFQAAMEAAGKDYAAYVIVSHDSVVCYEIEPGLEPLFAGTGLSKWRDLWYEEPYVALIAGDGRVEEFTGARQTALGLHLRDILRLPRNDRQRVLDALPRIAHAGGRWNGMDYTNSHEALEANGGDFELIEIDLAWTSDERLVCLHDWDAGFLAKDGALPAGPLPMAEFEARARAAPWHPCTLASLADWLRGHEGVRVVLDLKAGALDAYGAIAETYPDLLGRLIPQVYQPEDWARVRDMGYDDVIWTLYQYDGDSDAVLGWLARMDLPGLVMPPERLEAGLALRARAATGVLTWVHTINSRAELEAVLEAGASEVFTDVLKPAPILRYEVESSGDVAGASGLRSAGGELDLARGVNLVELGEAPRLLARFDGCAQLDGGGLPDPAPFHTALAEGLARKAALAVVVHDSAFCEGVAIAPLFAGSPLVKAPAIGFREPYVGVIRADGRVSETAGPAESSLSRSVVMEVAP